MDTRILPVPLVYQGSRGFCLYACTSMVLQYFGISKSIDNVADEVFFAWGHEQEGIHILTKNAGTLTDYISDNGLEAKYLSGCGWEDIKERIERGQPIIVGVKQHADDLKQNHAWVIRGIGIENDTKYIIYNEPNDNPEDDDPITFSPGGGIPGRTMEYGYFYDNHWRNELGFYNCVMIAVSFKGQGFGDQINFEGIGQRNGTRFIYHTIRATKATIELRPFEAVLEGFMAGILFVGTVAAFVQIVGQLIMEGGKRIVNKGRDFLKKEGIGWKVLGGALYVIGSFIAAAGAIINVVGGGIGLAVAGAASLIDSIASFFTGSSGATKSKKLGDTHIDLGLILQVEPWASRWGDNWEDISGVWAIQVRDLSNLDALEVKWKIEIGGVGIDPWDLDRHINYLNPDPGATVVYDSTDNPTNHNKKYKIKVTNVNTIFVGCGGRCEYGGDGTMTMVKLKVEATAKKDGQSVTITKSATIYGVSS